MVTVPLEVYLDFSLRNRAKNIVINANEIKSQQSDFNIFYLTNKFKAEGKRLVSKKLVTDYTFFLRFVDETGHIDFKMIKAAYFANVIESDFDTFSFYPEDPSEYANYYEGKEVPPEGDWLYFAYNPFGTNEIELLNGDVVRTCGETGRVWISGEQRGFKGYKSVPKVQELFAMGPYKILKLVIHTKWEPYGPQSYSMSLFAPDMREEDDVDYETVAIDDSFLVYAKADDFVTEPSLSLVNHAGQGGVPVNGVIEDGNPLEGMSKHIRIGRSGYIDLRGFSVEKSFTAHMNFSINDTGHRGTVLLDIAHDNGNLTVWLNGNGELCYNGKHMDEAINTKHVIKKHVLTTLTVVQSNVKITEVDNDEWACFIFVNGKQVWPKELYLNPDEQELVRRAYRVHKLYTDVCLKLEANAATVSGLDPKAICIKKLLKESGFVRLETLQAAYSLYLRRPKVLSVDVGRDPFSPSSIAMFQDARYDIMDPEYYFDGEVYEIALINRDLTRDEIDKIALFNSLGYPSFGV